MNFTSPSCFVFLSCALVLLSIDSWARFRQWIVFGLSVAFAAAVYRDSPKSFVFLLAWVLINYAVVKAMLACPRSRGTRAVIYYSWLAIAICAFVIAKQYFWLLDPFVDRRWATLDLFTVGLSFILFRQVALGVDVRDGLVRNVGFIEHFNYNLAFWTFIAGPLPRFEASREQYQAFCTSRIGIASRTVLVGLNRVMFGFIKMVPIAGWLGGFANTRTFTSHPDIVHLTVFLLSFPAYLYMNFSGYTDIVIGFGSAVGFVLPENFRQPYLARNVSDFWNRWHITFIGTASRLLCYSRCKQH